MNVDDAIKVVDNHIDDRLNDPGVYHNTDLTTAMCCLVSFAKLALELLPDETVEAFDKPLEVEQDYIERAINSDGCPFCGETRTVSGEEFSQEIAHVCPACGGTWVVVHKPTVTVSYKPTAIMVGEQTYRKEA